MSENTLSDDRFLTLQEVADLLKIKERTIYQWGTIGKIPGFKLGNASSTGMILKSGLKNKNKNHPKDKEKNTES